MDRSRRRMVTQRRLLASRPRHQPGRSRSCRNRVDPAADGRSRRAPRSGSRCSCRSNRFRFPEGDRKVVTLTQPNQIVTFEATALASGQGTIEVVVRAPSGRAIRQTKLTRQFTVGQPRRPHRDRGGGVGPGRSLVRRLFRRRRRHRARPGQSVGRQRACVRARHRRHVGRHDAVADHRIPAAVGADRRRWASSALGNTYATANTTPNIDVRAGAGRDPARPSSYRCSSRWLQKHGRDEAWMVADRVLTLALVVLSRRRHRRARSSRRRSCGCTCSASDAPTRRRRSSWARSSSGGSCRRSCSTGSGAVATGLLRSGTEVRRADVRADPQQPHGDRHVRRLRAAGRGRNDLRRTASRSPRRPSWRPGRTFGVAAMTLPALWPVARSLGFRWHLASTGTTAVRRLGKARALWVVVYVVANQIAYIVIIVFTGKFTDGYQIYAERVHPRSSSRTRSSPCRSSPRSCPPMSGRWDGRRHRRTAHAVLARGARHGS
mgnify:CR=1 FL=1